jgi:DNA ligase (NAD+)
MTKIERIKGLVTQLNQYRNEYYNSNKPSVPDSTYDNLFDELNQLENETKFILSNSPTQTVGFEVVSKLQKVTHKTPLKSLDKTKSIDELNKWINNKDIILMLKADGLTIELDYENGTLIEASTRGNGEIGEEITNNAKTFKNIPLSISFKGKLRISGEAIIHKNDFDEINSKLSEEEKYATPRNLVAGSVRQLDSKICSERNVYFYAFNILECSEELDDSKYDNFHWLGNLGFFTIPYSSIKFDIAQNNINNMQELAQEMNIPIDGLVVSFDSIKYSELLGETSHHPLHSLAFKFSDESETTILKEIEWSVGRTSVITPVAIFDTVILDNTEVSRASLHNLSIIEELELGIGDSISVIKANMIIPQIEDNFTRSNNLIIPDKCPSCGDKTIIDVKNIEGLTFTEPRKFLKCTNDNCPAKLVQKFAHFVSRNAINIEGLSEATLEKFINEGFITTFEDIYNINQYENEIIKMDGFGSRSYTKLIEAIEKSKDVKFENFIFALGINQIGLGGAKRLAKHFKNDINIFINEASISPVYFTQIEDFGDITANAVYDYFQNKDNIGQVKELLKYVVIKQEEKKIDNNLKDLTGLTFVITGSVTTFKNRDEFKELVESLNGKVAGSVSNKTNYLVNNNVDSTTGKNKTAKELGVKIISELDFNIMINR